MITFIRHLMVRGSIIGRVVLGLVFILLIDVIVDIQAQLDATILQNAGLYAGARLINATVSVVQSTDVGGVIFSVEIGQILDPVNDAVERFATVLTWAMGSLFVQKFSITLVSTWTFNVIAISIGLTTIFLIAVRQVPESITNLSLRIFGLVVGLKLIALISIGSASFIGEQAIRETRIQAEASLKDFGQQATMIKGIVTGSVDLTVERKEALNQDLGDISEQKVQSEATIDVLNEKLSELDSALNAIRQDEDLSQKACRLLPLCTQDRLPSEEEIEREISELQIALKSEAETIEKLEERMECLKSEISGESCVSILDKGKAFMDGLNSLAAKTPSLTNDLITLMAALLFKNIFLPIIIAFAAIKIGPTWMLKLFEPIRPTIKDEPEPEPEPLLDSNYHKP